METPATQKMNWKKFTALVHYVCEKADDPACLGSIKLNKVLWYSDAIYYLMTGRSITGETYVKRQHGPVPQHIVPAINELVRQNKIMRGKVDHFGHLKNEYISILTADKSEFTGEEVAVINEAFEYVCINHTASSISEETHNVIWQIAEMGEEIPLYTAFAAKIGEIDESDLEWAVKKLAA